MPTSYERINYNLRPAKSIERKMLCETFRKLSAYSDLSKYRYIGFGSTFFTDFSLIHKTLGVSDMISIEKEEKDRKRFRFNRPYKCIKLRFGDTNDVLPTISWPKKKKTILWLDYDYSLRDSMLTDIGTFISRAQTGSIILLTMDVTPDQLCNADNDKPRYAQLVERLTKIPIDVKEKDLDKQNYPRICYNIVNNEIDEVLAKRNGGLESNSKLLYKQLFNFLYQDGSAPMLTIGGILYSTNDAPKIEKCDFEALTFIKAQKSKYDPYNIKIPVLTFNEMRYLDRNNGKPSFLSEQMEKEYRDIYRYFPNFVEAEMH